MATQTCAHFAVLQVWKIPALHAFEIWMLLENDRRRRGCSWTMLGWLAYSEKLQDRTATECYQSRQLKLSLWSLDDIVVLPCHFGSSAVVSKAPDWHKLAKLTVAWTSQVAVLIVEKNRTSNVTSAGWHLRGAYHLVKHRTLNAWNFWTLHRRYLEISRMKEIFPPTKIFHCHYTMNSFQKCQQKAYTHWNCKARKS